MHRVHAHTHTLVLEWYCIFRAAQHLSGKQTKGKPFTKVVVCSSLPLRLSLCVWLPHLPLHSSSLSSQGLQSLSLFFLSPAEWHFSNDAVSLLLSPGLGLCRLSQSLHWSRFAHTLIIRPHHVPGVSWKSLTQNICHKSIIMVIPALLQQRMYTLRNEPNCNVCLFVPSWSLWICCLASCAYSI